MLRIGLTGGIGSGKTTVCSLFELLGVKVYYSDIVAKGLMQKDNGLIQVIQNTFGDEIFNEKNHIDTKALANIVFNNRSSLTKLNSLVHPVVMKDFKNWCDYYLDEKYIIIESAILFETGIYKELDKTICVYAPMDIKIARIISRDGVSPEKVIERIENQLPDNEKIQLSDYVIINDEKKSLIEQVTTLHDELLSY